MINGNPQLEDGYTKIANELLEAVVRQPFNNYEFRVVIALIRKTYGYGKTKDYIALSQLSDLTGITKPHLSRTLKKLQEYEVITYLGKSLGINKNYLAWKVTKLGNAKKGFNALPKQATPLPKQATVVTKLGNEKLPKQALQKKKETYTKETITKERTKNIFLPPSLSEEDFIYIANFYEVPLAFVKSKYDDMLLWIDGKPGNAKLKGRDWKKTLMKWVKDEKLKLIDKERRKNGRQGLTIITPDPAWGW